MCSRFVIDDNCEVCLQPIHAGCLRANTAQVYVNKTIEFSLNSQSLD